ncbi:FadR/GntR family transcriptional regulator [Corynebacterium freiburgense]|uniref:FadR/GntR family transcriptional regulator n=1 Tax=Corynebacterium freiburgense TaxID=556548 RepID=UPI0004200B56|nr:FCD domain-containing protein [Corynebacterium freiburgense]WJZ02972.1 HTH-type transcriptional regulator LutR [Corynebacterium freiburgense]
MVSRARNTAQSAVEGIEDYIRRHNLHVGDLLPSEKELCEELGCSRSSLREAMRTLVSLDIVQVCQGQGTYISKMSLAPLVRGMVLRVTLDVDQSFDHLLQVVDTREALEQSLADELVSVHDDESVAELRSIVSNMEESVRKGESFGEADQQFHAVLLARTKNKLIRELSDALWQIHAEVIPLLDLPIAEDLERTIASHKDMVEALAQKDSVSFQKAVQSHYGPVRHTISLHNHNQRSQAAGS